MVDFSGVMLCISLSFACIPITCFFLLDDHVSQKLPMHIAEYSMLVTALGIFLLCLKPSRDFWNFNKRGAFYYACCILCCAATTQLTVHGMRLNLFGGAKKPKYFDSDELYIKTPYGSSSELWFDVVSYILYLLMVFQIDNKTSVRNVALYWCGATLSSVFVTGIGLLTGPYATKIYFSSFSLFFYIFFTLWVLRYFIVQKPRFVCGLREGRGSGYFEFVIAALLLYSALFSFLRVLGVFNSNLNFVKNYVGKFEPYITHPSKFGSIWILYAALYGIPCQLKSLYHIHHATYRAATNMALIYAGSIMQGTFVYLSYSAYPSSDQKGRIPKSAFGVVMVLNIMLIIGAHIFLFRCLRSTPYHSKKFKCVYVNDDYVDDDDDDENECVEEEEDEDEDYDDEDAVCNAPIRKKKRY